MLGSPHSVVADAAPRRWWPGLSRPDSDPNRRRAVAVGGPRAGAQEGDLLAAVQSAGNLAASTVPAARTALFLVLIISSAPSRACSLCLAVLTRAPRTM